MSVVDSLSNAFSVTSTIINHAKGGKKIVDVLMDLEDIKMTLLLSKQEVTSLNNALLEKDKLIASYENFAREAENYVLHRLSSGTWVMAYPRSERPITEGGTPTRQEIEEGIHYCKWCFDQKQRSVLQPNPDSSNVLMCHRCKSRIKVNKTADFCFESF